MTTGLAVTTKRTPTSAATTILDATNDIDRPWCRPNESAKLSYVVRFCNDQPSNSDRSVHCAEQWVWLNAKLVSQLLLRAQSTTKDDIRAENKLQSISQLFISQVIIPQSLFFSHKHNSNSIHNFGTQNQKNNNTCLGVYYTPLALNKGTCIEQSDLFYSVGLHRNRY